MGQGACGATLRTLDWTDSNLPGRDEGKLKPGAEAGPLGVFAALGVLLNLDWSNSAALGRRRVSSPVAPNGKRFANAPGL